MDPYFFNNTVALLQSFLADKADITSDFSTLTVIIKPIKPSSFRVGTFLTCLQHPLWNNITISPDIKVVLDEWLIDVDDMDEYGDNWCLKWMTSRYNVVNKCENWKKKYESLEL